MCRARFYLDPFISDRAPHQNAGFVVSLSQDYVDTVRKTTQWDPPVVAPAYSGGGHGAMSSEPPQGPVRGARVADPPSKTDDSTSPSKRNSSRRAPPIHEIGLPRHRNRTQQESGPEEDRKNAIPAPSGGILSYSSGGRGDSSAASAGRGIGVHAVPSSR